MSPRRALAGLAALLWSSTASAQQVITDGTLGRDGRVALPGRDVTVPERLGAIRGGNLFHSFERFGVADGGRVTFTGPSNLDNVISRVTGDAPSAIDGTLRSRVGDAEVYLINPNGVTFGPNAKLDVPGSFHASTADELRFEDGNVYSAVDPANAVLSVAAPQSFGFLGANPGAIAVRGSELKVEPGKTLSLTSGDLTIAGAKVGLNAADLSLSSVKSPSSVPVGGDSARPSSGGSVRVTQASEVGSVNGGRVLVRAGGLVVDGDSVLKASTESAANAGTLDIALANDLKITDGTVGVGSQASASGNAGRLLVQSRDMLVGGAFGRLDATTFGPGGGAGGVIKIDARALTLRNGGKIVAGSEGAGNGGRVAIKASRILITGWDRTTPAIEFRAQRSGVFTTSGLYGRYVASGDAGGIEIEAAELVIDDAGAIDATALSGDGNHSGPVSIEVDSLILMSGGQIGNGSYTSGAAPLPSDVQPNLDVTAHREVVIEGISRDGVAENAFLRSGLFNDVYGDTTAGDIIIKTPSLRVDGGRIAADVDNGAPAPAGDIIVTSLSDTPRDTVDVTITNEGQIFAGTNAQGAGGDIIVRNGGRIVILGTTDSTRATPDTDNQNPTGIYSNVKLSGSGPGGSIDLRARDVIVGRGGVISTQTAGAGPAGAVDLTLSGDLRVEDGVIETAVADASQIGSGLPATPLTTGGPLTIMAGSVTVADGGRISARSVRGPGQAGDVTVTTADGVNLDGGSIETEAAAAGGGRVVLQGGRLVRLTDGGRVSSTVVGDRTTTAGDVAIDGRSLVLGDGAILAQANAGRGGNIRIEADDIVASPEGRIDASAATGVDGTVATSSPEVDLTGGLTILPTVFLNAGNLLRESCDARADDLSSFTAAGRGGLPPSPEDALTAPYRAAWDGATTKRAGVAAGPVLDCGARTAE